MLIKSHRKLTAAVAAIPINKVSTCSSILTRTRQTLINLHLTVSPNVARLTGTEVVIKMVLRREKEPDNQYMNARKKNT